MKRSEKLDICDNCEHMEFQGRYQLAFCDKHKKLITYIDKCEKWSINMTEEEKQNCLKVRYAFDKMEKKQGKSPGRSSRRKEWKLFLNEKITSGEITGYEAQLCLEEFIPEKGK
jgi:hypothetical protein